MPQRPRIELTAVLNEGRRLLQMGDVGNYWKLMAGYAPYAGFAGDIAAIDGAMAVIVAGHVHKKAESKLGRELTHDEWQELTLRIAKGDLVARETNVHKFGDIRATSGQIDRYHTEAFESVGLDADTFLPHALDDVVGPYWTVIVGAPTLDMSDDASMEFYREQKANDIGGMQSDPVGFLRRAEGIFDAVGEGISTGREMLDPDLPRWIDRIDGKPVPPRPSFFDAGPMSAVPQPGKYFASTAPAAAKTNFVLPELRVPPPEKKADAEQVMEYITDPVAEGPFEDGGPLSAVAGEAPVNTRDGYPLRDGLIHVGRRIAEDARGLSTQLSVGHVQRAINNLDKPKWDPARKVDKWLPPFPLATDGQLGPKTRRALKGALAEHGLGAVSSALDMTMGRIDDPVRKARRNFRFV